MACFIIMMAERTTVAASPARRPFPYFSALLIAWLLGRMDGNSKSRIECAGGCPISARRFALTVRDNARRFLCDGTDHWELAQAFFGMF
jgi:hypothetical protein